MVERRSVTLPPPLERAVRMASVAPHVAAMFAHLPQPIRVDAELPPEVAAAPSVAVQLLKLPMLVDRVRLGSVETAGAPRVVLSLGERRCVLEAGDLERDLAAVARTILSTLLEGSDVARVLEAFAFQSANLVTLQRITNHMLGATDLDRALYVMLSGITSGHGLAFNRAALFVYDDARRNFVGSKAIGPADEAEAHRIWEAIELEEKSLEQVIADGSEQRFDTRFQKEVQSIVAELGREPDDEITTTLVEPGCVSFTRSPVNKAFARLDATAGFVLAAIRAHGHVRGLLFADNRWSGEPVTPGQLAHIGFYIDQTALVWESLSLLSRVEALAREDPLTGLYNRREFDVRFETERARCERAGTSCSVMMMDVDHFKTINDTQGHAAGDDVLRRLGALLRRQLREYDVAARFGGDELVVLLPGANAEQVASAAQRFGALAHAEAISLSIGGATWPGELESMDRLLSAADAQLYAAKRAGRGCAFVRNVRLVY